MHIHLFSHYERKRIRREGNTIFEYEKDVHYWHSIEIHLNSKLLSIQSKKNTGMCFSKNNGNLHETGVVSGENLSALGSRSWENDSHQYPVLDAASSTNMCDTITAHLTGIQLEGNSHLNDYSMSNVINEPGTMFPPYIRIFSVEGTEIHEEQERNRG